jgi:hypothetical protein
VEQKCKGKKDSCRHARCITCYNLDKNGNVISQCGGQAVDEVEYNEWYRDMVSEAMEGI